MMEMFNILFKNERLFGARSSSCNLVDALLGAGSALIGSAFSSGQTKSQQAWSDKQRLAQEGFVRSMWNANNEYNTPVNQMKRLQDAGINPWMSLGQSQSASGQSTLAGSAGSAPSAPTGFNYNPVDGISSIASAYKSLADAKKAGVETESLEKTMDSYVRKAGADATKAELEADLQSFTNELTKKYGDRRAQAEVHKFESDFLLNMAKIDTEKEMKEYVSNQAKEMAERVKLTKNQRIELENWLNGWAAEYWQRRNDNLLADTNNKNAQTKETNELLPYKKSNLSADTNDKNASAGLKKAQSITENGTRADRAKLLSLQARSAQLLYDRELKKQPYYLENEYKNIVNEAYRNGYITSQEFEKLKIFEGDVSWQWLEKFTNLASKFVPGGSVSNSTD